MGIKTKCSNHSLLHRHKISHINVILGFSYTPQSAELICKLALTHEILIGLKCWLYVFKQKEKKSFSLFLPFSVAVYIQNL